MEDNRYISDSGEFKWEVASRILIDLNDGYLSNLQGIKYTNVSSSDNTLFKLHTSSQDGGEEVDVTGSQLLKTVSKFSSAISDGKFEKCSEEEALYRASKFVPTVSKLSDEYAMEDGTYREQWHPDVLNICEAIKQAQ